MGAFTAFVEELLTHGVAVLRERPRLPATDRSAATRVLAAAHADAVLEVAGPALPFDAEAALDAAQAMWSACWFLLSRQEAPEDVVGLLPVVRPASTAAAHLSADVVFRYLPALHRRSRALSQDDVLTSWLADTLRAWPLSGALSDLDPLASPSFGHSGLDLLFAERMAARKRDATP